MAMDELKVLTLNCWGIHFVSKEVSTRIRLIGQELAQRDFDLVALQEVWRNEDFDIIRELVAEKLPFAHYFHNGIIGSGCCVFSRYPICDVFFQQYSFNGYAWALSHADYFGGKGLGCIIVKHPLGKVYFFNTHLHANYAENDYFAVRTLQMYQFTQIINHTTQQGDLVIACGDFNHEYEEVGMRAIKYLTSLEDSKYTAAKKPLECFTSNCKSNPYSTQKEPEKRIDYIFHSDLFDCLEHCLDLQKDTATGIHFSDHEGVVAKLKFRKNLCHRERVVEKSKVLNLLREVQSVMQSGQTFAEELHWRKIVAIWLLFLVFICMPVFSVDSFYLIFPALDTWQGKGVFVLQILSIVFCAAYVWITVIIRRIEVNAYRNVVNEIELKLKALEYDD